LAVAIGLGVVSTLRPSGLAVAPSIASTPMHFRYSVALFYGCVAMVLSIFWFRLAIDARVIKALRHQVSRALLLCAAGPLVTVAANWAIVEGITSRHVALLPALIAPAVAGLYAVTTHRLSGITGVGLGARLVLRSSYVWLIVGSCLQLLWVAVRVFGDGGNLLWFVERPTLELTMLGFGISAAVGVLLTSLNATYHSRDLTQT
jgi:hypothetical protein